MDILLVEMSVDETGEHLSITTHPNHRFRFEEIRNAMIKMRDELTRQIEIGPFKCPFRNYQGEKGTS
jgi:hypothetical protein